MGFRNEVKPAAVRDFRERRGWTHEQIAEEVGGTPLEVAAWESGAVRVPPEQAARIRALAREEVRRAEVLRAGLPPCPWADANAPELHAVLALGTLFDDGLTPAQRWHVDQCHACRRVRDFSRSLSLPPLDPGLGHDPRETLVHWMSRGPGSVLLLLGGGGLLVFIAYQLLWMLLPDLPRTGWPAELGPAVLGAGFVMRVVSRLMPSFSRKRPYVAGALEALAAVLTGLLVWSSMDASHQAGAAVLSLCAGLVIVLALLCGGFNDWTSGRAAEDEEGAESEEERLLRRLGLEASRLGEGAHPEPDLARSTQVEQIRVPATGRDEGVC